jgi:signal transduction histidine kinase
VVGLVSGWVVKQRVFFTKEKAQWLTSFSAGAGFFIAVNALLILFAWIFGAESVIRILPGMVVMNPVTAVVFTCLGVALWLKTAKENSRSKLAKNAPYALAAIVALVSAIKLFQCGSGWFFHIDRLLFASRLATTNGEPANAMAPNTALAFFCAGLALISMDFELKNGVRPSQFLALASGFIALLALIGYSYCVLLLYQLRGAMPMALISAIDFMAFCLGFLAARPQSGMMRLITSPTNGGAVARRLLPMAIFVPWVIGAVLLAAEQKQFFRTDAAISIFAVASICIFTALVWWNAKLLYRTDQERLAAEERLHRASANLERSNTELEQFAYTASHDLNEPLRMITSYLQLLQHRSKEKLDTQANEFISFALDGAERMRALIRDLLAYSRLEAQKKEFQETDCEEVFQTAVQNLRVAIEENKAIINHERLPHVSGDPLQLTQVFQNLIGNALKFHRAGPPSIEVAANQQNGEWIFSVRDNGIGIDPKDFQRIFEIFQRLHSREEYSGTGMGLSISKKIVESHGGRIWVESAPQKGSTFYFTLPAMKNGPSP